MEFLGWFVLVSLMVGIAAALAARAGHRWAREDIASDHGDLIQTLRWYGDTTHWRRRTKTGRHWSNSPAAADRGGKARAALTKWDGVGNGGAR